MNFRQIALISLAFFAMASCKKSHTDNDIYTVGHDNGIQLSEIIKFESTTGPELVADSSSSVSVNVHIDPRTDSASRKVTFTTTLGVFDNLDDTISVFANSNGIATANLRGHKEGSAMVKAYIGTYSIDTTIRLTSALPDNMLLSVDKNIVDTTDTVNLTCQLTRKPGWVSNGVYVYFKVSGSASGKNLVLPDYAISQSGMTTIQVRNPYNLHGDFQITAYTVSGPGDTLRKSVPVTVR